MIQRKLAASVLLVFGLATFSTMLEAYAGEYKSKAQKKVLIKDSLGAIAGKEANIIRFDLPPGHVGGRHYHTGDVFVYIQEGSLTINVNGKKQVFKAGEVYHEKPNVAMVASNEMTSGKTTLVVFQVGNQGEPIMMKAK